MGILRPYFLMNATGGSSRVTGITMRAAISIPRSSSRYRIRMGAAVIRVRRLSISWTRGAYAGRTFSHRSCRIRIPTATSITASLRFMSNANFRFERSAIGIMIGGAVSITLLSIMLMG
jgi:hypothetical protein